MLDSLSKTVREVPLSVLQRDSGAPLGTPPPGTPDRVYDYCKRLIQDVGKDSGFILSSGSGVPTNVKPENFEAFLRAARKVCPV